MKLQNGQTQTQCEDFRQVVSTHMFSGLLQNPIETAAEPLLLLCDDGFELFRCKPSDFARVHYTDGTLLLTNEPEPPPVPDEPVERLPTPDEDRDALLVDLDYRLTLVELGVLGQEAAKKPPL